MAAKVRLSPTARSDIANISDWGAARYGQDAADDYTRGFARVFQLLREQPKAGAIRPGIRPQHRTFVHRRHIVYYRLQSDDVLIVRILHHAQDARRALRQ